MDWADELAAQVSGPQVVNDSKTPSGTGPRRAACAARSSSTSSPAPCARTALETTLLYGVDDLDPMDAQALLTPDAVEREMGRPLAHVPDPAGDCHASLRPPLRAASSSTRSPASASIPDRYYWMSDIYPTGRDGPVHPDCALDQRGRSSARSTGASPTSSIPTTGIRSASSARTAARSARRSSPTGTASVVFYECRPRPRRRGRPAAAHPAGSAPFGGAAKLPWNLEWAAQWSLFGVTIEPCGKDLSTAGGSRDRVGRDRPRGLRARAAAQRPVRVPQHRRQEDVDLEGPRRGRPHDRRGHPAGAARASCSSGREPNQRHRLRPDGTDAVPRLFDEFDRFAAATAGREVKGEIAPGFEATFRYSLLDPDADVAAEAARVPARVRPPRAARSRSRTSTSRRGSTAEKGERADRARGGDPRRAGRGRARAGSRRTRPTRRGSRSAATRCPPTPRPARRRPARATSLALADARRRATRPADGDAWQNAHLRRRPTQPGSTRNGARSRRSTSRSSAGRTARAPAGCSRASSRASSSTGCARRRAGATVGGAA